MDILIGLLLVIIVAIMPLITRVIELPLPPELIGIKAGETFFDIFAHWKGIFIGIPAVIIAFFRISDTATSGKMPDFKEIFKRPPVIFSTVFIIFSILSTIFSSYTHTSIHGTAYRSEGLLMWLAYFIVFFAAASFVREIKHAKIIMLGLAFSSILMGAIGTGQLFGYDFFETRAGAIWVVGFGSSLGISTAFDIAHGTLFNPNTFGKYTAMLTPIFLLAALTYSGKKYINVIFLTAGGLMLLSAFGSGSLGGLIGIITAVLVLAITAACVMFKSPALARKIAFGAAGAFFALVLGILFITPLNVRVTHLFNRLDAAMRAETISGSDYRFEGNTLTVYLAGEKLYSIRVNSLDGQPDEWLTITNSQGEISPLLAYDVQGDFSAYLYEGDMIIQRIGNQAFQAAGFKLTLYQDTIYGLWVNGYEGLIDLSEDFPAWGFYGRETWGSNRGYIWSRSFPLMPRRTIIGSGPDTFINVFPIFDLVGTQRFFNNPYQIVDKAHNLFIQTWITTGGISAIALFLLFGHYLLTTFKSLLKATSIPFFSLGLRLGLLAGVSAFIMASMATDSTIGSTGVFFVLLGVGYGLINKKERV